MYAVIDIESNGASFGQECIIEVAIYQYDGHRITDQFISMVNPEGEILPFVQKLTGITPKMVKTAPKFHEIAKRIIEITEGTTLVGHNVDFDYRMLRQSFKRLGYDFSIDTIDTIPLAKKLIPNEESYSLGKLVKSLGIPLTDRHRAGGDARATLDLFRFLMVKDENNEIIQTHHREANAKTYANKVKAITQDLPNNKGIIYLQNSKGEVLYYDYTDNINRFAKKIFSSKSLKNIQLQKEIEQIQYDLVGNDLLAKLIMATKGIKKRFSLPYGLYDKKGQWIIEKNKQNTGSPILKFKSYTQAMKVLNFIKNNEKEEVLKRIQIPEKECLVIMKGRVRGEKAFLTIEAGKITAYGFYEIYTQVQTRENIDKIKVPVRRYAKDWGNDLKLELLKGEIEILPLPN